VKTARLDDMAAMGSRCRPEVDPDRWRRGRSRSPMRASSAGVKVTAMTTAVAMQTAAVMP